MKQQKKTSIANETHQKVPIKSLKLMESDDFKSVLNCMRSNSDSKNIKHLIAS